MQLPKLITFMCTLLEFHVNKMLVIVYKLYDGCSFNTRTIAIVKKVMAVEL